MTAITIVLIINFLMLAANIAMFVGNRKILDKIGQVIHKLNEGVMAETITERDAFAIAALSGMLAHSTRYKPREEGADWHWSIAKEAYELADAMMERRRQE